MAIGTRGMTSMTDHDVLTVLTCTRACVLMVNHFPGKTGTHQVRRFVLSLYVNGICCNDSASGTASCSSRKFDHRAGMTSYYIINFVLSSYLTTSAGYCQLYYLLGLIFGGELQVSKTCLYYLIARPPSKPI
jgi:hypothetical protein